MTNDKNMTERPQKWMYFVWGFILFSIVMLLVPSADIEPEEYTRTYEHWMGASYPVLTGIAAARYVKDNESLSPDDYDFLIENGGKELNRRAEKIVDCGRSSPKLDLNDGDDYFDAIIDFCIDKLAI